VSNNVALKYEFEVGVQFNAPLT